MAPSSSGEAQLGQPPQIDFNYYLERVFKNALDQLLEVGYKDALEPLRGFGYTPPRCKLRGLNEPVRLISSLYDNGHSVDNFEKAINHLFRPKLVIVREPSSDENPNRTRSAINPATRRLQGGRS